MFSCCLRLSTSSNKFPFFFTFLAVAWVDNTFSIKKGENLARQISSKDSMAMNLGKSVTSFSESDSDRFRFFFEDTISDIFIFSWSFAPPHTTESNLCWECTKGETHSLWLIRGYTTSILELGKCFQALVNYRFSAVVRFLFSQRNWSSLLPSSA